ncbi:hypothetical protein PN36_24520 [Candidatus Thiomargarita nelsonii]|uniref:Uncharacterized protein n=1 Tax=Candidatus Thiomargarita nelsonii TaxID=1003181 RepID=A0A0A6PG76_9GAMM|nr:hypothetical protein PN36_24520 [Candidatus Thiomargarita nelsonii]
MRLPKLDERGAKPLDKAWLTECELKKVLAGELPEDVICQSNLFQSEPRLGIVRDNGVTKEGLLYQAQYLRMSEYIKIGAIVSGIDFQPTTKQRTRFGGEGRLASVEVTDDHILYPPKIQSNQGQNLLLMLLTPADLGCKKESWLPSSNFKKVNRPIIDGKKSTVWEVNINGVELSIISAVLGKTVQEGGWNLRQNCPRPLKSLVPAGSVWFCQVKENLASAIEKLHGFQIGEETALGRGELFAGIWK